MYSPPQNLQSGTTIMESLTGNPPAGSCGGSLCSLHLSWWACGWIEGPIQTSQLSKINKPKGDMGSFVS